MSLPISRRSFIMTSALFAGGLLSSMAFEAPPRRPNIVFFLVDDFGKGCLAGMGSDLHETPNIDTLVQSGMQFTDGYAACTVCSPSRSAILSGRYPGRTHLTDWIPGHNKQNAKLKIPDWKMCMDHDWVLLPEALKNEGYATGFFGKWHLMPPRDKELMKNHLPTDHGFDINIGGREWGEPKGPGRYFHPFDMPNIESQKGDYLTDRLTDYAVDFVGKNKSNPFFLYMSYYTVHGPIMGKPELVEKYKKKIAAGKYKQKDPNYAAMCESLDTSVGRILKTLKDNGLDKDTIVVFTGDNGSAFRAYTGGLRNYKGYSHEGAVREPVLISWPGVIKAGSVSHVPMIGTDFYPTLLDLAGLPLQKDQHLDGVSLKPVLLQQGTIPERSLFWHYPHYHQTTPYGATRKDKWKLIEFFEDGKLELYDLSRDIAETTNLAEKNPEVAKALLEEMREWRTSVNAQMPTPNPLAKKPEAKEPQKKR
jgi:arylsulfatase A-like enzyme